MTGMALVIMMPMVRVISGWSNGQRLIAGTAPTEAQFTKTCDAVGGVPDSFSNPYLWRASNVTRLSLV
jgi:hypothetical protein